MVLSDGYCFCSSPNEQIKQKSAVKLQIAICFPGAYPPSPFPPAFPPPLIPIMLTMAKIDKYIWQVYFSTVTDTPSSDSHGHSSCTYLKHCKAQNSIFWGGYLKKNKQKKQITTTKKITLCCQIWHSILGIFALIICLTCKSDKPQQVLPKKQLVLIAVLHKLPTGLQDVNS